MSFFDDLEAFIDSIFRPATNPPNPPKADPGTKALAKPPGSAPSVAKAAMAKFEKGRPKAARPKFGAPKIAGPGKTPPVYSAADLPMATLAIQKCFENSRNAESNYDTLKDSEGWGVVADIFDAVGQLKDVYDDPTKVGGLHSAGGNLTDNPKVKLPQNTGDIGRWHREAKAYFYKAHESSLAQGLSYAGPQFIILKSEHRGEEFVWNHAMVLGPDGFREFA